MRALTSVAALCFLAASASAVAQGSAPEVTLTRIECGTSGEPTEVNQRFSDIFAYPGLKLQFVYSCYLIKHGADYMVWDTGFNEKSGPRAPKTKLVDQLAQVNVKPEQVKFVGISHYHGDHIGQAGSFPQATLLIGKGDWEGLTAAKPAPGIDPSSFAHWISGGGKMEVVPTDKDVFGDGTVVMIGTPGHTPGHHSLIVKLVETGPVILSGDFVHFRENYDGAGVPWFNFDRAQTLASIDRVKKLEANLKGKVIIQHDARDVAKLPAFPAAAK